MNDKSAIRYPESTAISGARREIARQEFAARRRILELLREKGPLTVPELAQALKIPSFEAHWWLMGYMRYGKVTASEKADADGYYRYSLAEGK